MMPSNVAAPRDSNPRQPLQVFEHLRKHHYSERTFDPSNPVINETEFER